MELYFDIYDFLIFRDFSRILIFFINLFKFIYIYLELKRIKNIKNFDDAEIDVARAKTCCHMVTYVHSTWHICMHVFTCGCARVCTNAHVCGYVCMCVISEI